MYLVTLLTSSGIEFLIESVNSFRNQKGLGSDKDKFKLIIVVNTLNNDYYNLVMEKFKGDIEVIRTESNGKPGKGHNSLLELFKNKIEFDYLIPIDGDDFLYPFALKRLL